MLQVCWTSPCNYMTFLFCDCDKIEVGDTVERKLKKIKKNRRKLSENGPIKEESNVGIRSVYQYLFFSHFRLRVLPLRVQHLILHFSHSSSNPPLWIFLSELSVPGFWHLCVYICMYVWTGLSLQPKYVRNI